MFFRIFKIIDVCYLNKFGLQTWVIYCIKVLSGQRLARFEVIQGYPGLYLKTRKLLIKLCFLDWLFQVYIPRTLFIGLKSYKNNFPSHRRCWNSPVSKHDSQKKSRIYRIVAIMLSQGSVNIFWEGPGSKYFQLCGHMVPVTILKSAMSQKQL